jgi:predicted DNA-binding protein
MSTKKDGWIQVRVSPEEKEKLAELVETLDKPASQIVRDEIQDRWEAEKRKRSKAVTV